MRQEALGSPVLRRSVRLRRLLPGAEAATTETPPASGSSTAYLAGVFAGQLANNALNVTMPLLLLQISQAIGLVAFITALGQGLDAAGTLLGGSLGARWSPRRVLVAATAARFVALAALPMLLVAQSLTMAVAVGIYLIDSLARGVTDTARSTVPMTLVGNDVAALTRLNGRYQACFEAGNLAGPFVVAGLLLALGTVMANWLAPVAFALTAAIYLGVPRGEVVDVKGRKAADGVTMRAAFGTVLADRRLLLFFVSVVLLTLYPVKALLPVLFAGQVLHSPPAAAWLAGFFGLGGVAGSLLFNRLHKKVLVSTWLQWSAIGVAIYSTVFISANFFTMAAGIILFASTNVMARLATTSSLQAHLPHASGSAIMGVSRFSINILSMVLRLLVGVAFSIDLDPKQGFSTVGIILFTFALAQFAISHRIASRPVMDEIAPVPTADGADDEALPVPSALFDRDPANDPPELQRKFRKHGAYYYFRTLLLPMQRRFAELIDHRGMATVLLHGSPHLRNYAKSAQGAAMVDFDRARRGPYAWDIVRALTSLSLCRRKADGAFLDQAVVAAFRDGYLRGVRRPDLGYEQIAALRDTAPKAGERSIREYVRANGPWVRAMRETPLPVDHPEVVGLLGSYLASRQETALLDTYTVTEAGTGDGSFGGRHVLMLLTPHDPAQDQILLDLKPAHADPDDGWYHNPFGHQGQRIMAAADLYAPGWELRQGYATYDGREYWGHAVPAQNVKLKRRLKLDEQMDFAFAVGTQLGRGHRLSLGETAPEAFEQQFTAEYERIVDAGATIAREMAEAHARYLARLDGEHQARTGAPDGGAQGATEPRSRQRSAVVLGAGALAALLALAVFLVLPAIYGRHAVATPDRNVAFWAHDMVVTRIPHTVFTITLQLGAIEFVYGVSVLLGLLLWWKRADAVYYVSLLLLVAGTARLFSVEAKRFFLRQHAHFWSDQVMLKNAFLNPKNAATKGFSYPSTQAIVATCLFGFLLWVGWKFFFRRPLPRGLWLLLMLFCLALVGYSTLDTGTYYTTDVVGGYAFATFWVLTWLGLAPFVRRFGKSGWHPFRARP